MKTRNNYLHALREHDYLLFLQWPSALASPDAASDSILEQLTNEWLALGYTCADGKLVALLYRFYQEHAHYLSQDLQYAITTLSIATMHCMREQEGDPDLFNQWSKEYSSAQINTLLMELSPILQLRQQVMRYFDVLSRKNDEHDALLSSRLSMVGHLAHYVNSTTRVNIEVANEVANYLKRIHQLGSNAGEEEYLKAIDLFPSTITPWNWIAKIGLGFFSLLMEQNKEAKHVELESSMKK